jgi:transcriptional regulator with XRE-family HTH domain
MAYLKEPIILLAIGSKLKELRKKKEMSQEDVAYKAGIAVSQVGRIERGKLNPSISTLFVISLALEIEPKELFDFEQSFLRKKAEPKKKK